MGQTPGHPYVAQMRLLCAVHCLGSGHSRQRRLSSSEIAITALRNKPRRAKKPNRLLAGFCRAKCQVEETGLTGIECRAFMLSRAAHSSYPAYKRLAIDRMNRQVSVDRGVSADYGHARFRFCGITIRKFHP